MIEIYCKRGAGDKEMSPIDEPLISSEPMAVKRGKYEIERQWYLITSQRIRVPHKSNGSDPIQDNDIVSISSGVLGISGNRLVRKVTISGTPSDVVDNIEIANFEEFL